jgi:hypothetical protein
MSSTSGGGHPIHDDGAFYNLDDVLPRSPQLEPIKPNYKPSATPPPFLPSSSSHSPESEESELDLARDAESGNQARRFRKRKKGRKRKHVPSQGDTVLISYLDPNRPDIAQQAGQTALNSASQSEDEESEEDDVEDMVVVRGTENGIHHTPSKDHLQAKAEAALAEADLAAVKEDDLEMVDATPDQRSEEKRKNSEDSPTTNGVVNNGREAETSPDFAKPSPPSARSGFNLKPPPRLLPPPPPIRTETARPTEERSPDEDSTPISPRIARYVINPSEPDPESVLPAMQKSPPRSASTHSPEGSQSLPSLQTTLSGLSDHGINGIHAPSPFQTSSGHSPQLVRHPTFSSQSTGPSPGAYSQPSPGMSPPGYPSHPSYWRRPPTEGSMSTPSTHEASTPASIPGPSPAQSYPTPNVQDHRGSVEGSSTPQLLNGPLPPNGPFTSSTFKCTYSGCTAAPFQTQYLLNSHANVHSSNRPHFCPVADCPRGPGGKGFKRKNEMIRHGLVHQSPGYIW